MPRNHQKRCVAESPHRRALKEEIREKKRKSPWRSGAFKQLKGEWYKKIQELGFVDIEDEHGRLKQNASNSYRTSIQPVIESKLRYYELLGQMAHQETFRDHVERLIIERRSNGVKFKDICRELKEMGERCHKSTIRRIMRYYERKWGILRKP